MNLPEHIINKIMLYVSHPVADIVKESMETVTALCKNTCRDSYGETSTYSDMYFNCMEQYLNKRMNKDCYYLSNTKRKWISNGRYPYSLKHLTNAPVWY